MVAYAAQKPTLKANARQHSVHADVVDNLTDKQTMTKKYKWLEESGGYLAIGGRPSMQLIELLKKENCTTIITLLRESERKTVEEIGKKVHNMDMNWEWFPLSASALPQNNQLEKVREFLATIQERLKNGEQIFIHCAAGVHRTGAFTYGLLRYLGNTAENAKEKIKALRTITYEEAHDKHWAWGEQFGQSRLHRKPTANPIPTYPIPSSFGFQNCGSSNPSSDILQPWIRLSTSFSQISGSIWYCLQAEKKV